MSETTETTKQTDPMEKFREFRDAYLDIWSKTMIDAVNTEGYAQASGAALENYLNIAAPYKQAADDAMLRTLQQLSMPTSMDFAGLAGRFTNMEMQLDNMDAKLDRIEKRLNASQPVAHAEVAKPVAAAAAPAPVEEAPPLFKDAPVVTPAETEKAAPKAPAVTATAGSTSRTTTAKPLPRNARKGTK